MNNGEQKPTLLNGQRMYLPIATTISIIIFVVGAMIFVMNTERGARDYVDSNFVRQTEFETVKEDISEIKADVKLLLIQNNRISQ